MTQHRTKITTDGAARRIAVVGAGVSGLIAARELHLAGHDVRVFEANDYLGGHTNTITVDTERGPVDVDTGFIVLNDRNYPNFSRILAELNVPTQPSNMSFSVADGRGEFEWASRPFGLFARPAHAVDIRFYRMLLDLLRFNRDARRLIGVNGRGPSLRRFLLEHGYSGYFIERFIVPQVSAVWSADAEQLWDFPASFLAEFFDNHGILQLRGRPQWLSIPGGSRRYVAALATPFRDRLHINTPVRRVARDQDGVDVHLDHAVERFDEVVLAVHSDQALRMLADPSDAEREVLGALPYQRNETVLHTDRRLLPRRRSAWASWNFHLGEGEAGLSTVTYHMNRLQSLAADREFLVTLNRTAAIDPEQIIRVIDYEHPIFTRAGVAAQQRWPEISGRRHTHYCGAYWRWGFHEDGAWSGLRVSEQLGARGPGLEDASPPALADDRLPAIRAA